MSIAADGIRKYGSAPCRQSNRPLVFQRERRQRATVCSGRGAIHLSPFVIILKDIVVFPAATQDDNTAVISGAKGHSDASVNLVRSIGDDTLTPVPFEV